MKKTNNGKNTYKLLYLAATLFFISSIISSFSGTSSGSSLCLGGLFLVLGASMQKKTKDNENNKDTEDNK